MSGKAWLDKPEVICPDSVDGAHVLLTQYGEQWQWVKCICCACTLASWPRDFDPSDITLEKGANDGR